MLQMLVRQPEYFKGRVVVAGIESNLPIKLSKLQSKVRTFSSIIRDTPTKIIPTKPLFLTVPYPTFELPEPTVIDGFHRDKLLSSYWAPSAGSGQAKENMSGGVRSALEKFLYSHPNHSRRDVERSAGKLNQHAICVKGNDCITFPSTTRHMYGINERNKNPLDHIYWRRHRASALNPVAIPLPALIST